MGRFPGSSRSAESSDPPGAISLNELTPSVYDPNAHSTAFSVILVPGARMECDLAWLSAAQVAVPAPPSNTNANYATLAVCRYHNGVRSVIASKSTQTGVAEPATGGELFANLTAWTLNAAAWSWPNARLAVGDLVVCEWTFTGTGASLNPATYSFSLEPVRP
jgi:hypothetical protein